MTKEELFDLACDVYGQEHQLAKLAEECAEYLDAWLHILDGRCSQEHLEEELAGIFITAWQARKILGEEAIDRAIERQLEKMEQQVVAEDQKRRISWQRLEEKADD